MDAFLQGAQTLIINGTDATFLVPLNFSSSDNMDPAKLILWTLYWLCATYISVRVSSMDETLVGRKFIVWIHSYCSCKATAKRSCAGSSRKDSRRLSITWLFNRFNFKWRKPQRRWISMLTVRGGRKNQPRNPCGETYSATRRRSRHWTLMGMFPKYNVPAMGGYFVFKVNRCLFYVLFSRHGKNLQSTFLTFIT